MKQNAKLTEEFIQDGFSINSLKDLTRKNEGRFYSSTMEYFVILKIFKETQLEVEGNLYTIPAQKLVFIGQETFIKFVNTDPESVYVITFSSFFYEKSAKDSYLLNSNLFFDYSKDLHIIDTQISMADFKKHVIRRLKIYEKKSPNLYIPFAHNCIESLVLDGLLALEDDPFTKLKDFSYLKTVNKFKLQLHKNFISEKTVQFYARLLHLTPRKLTEICEVTLGKTAKQVILDKIVHETKRLLQNSDVTIAEVSYHLGFNDEANFSKLIKKHSGKNPKELKMLHN